MRALLIGFTFILPYHVMRTATLAGHRVHTLGAGYSRGVRLSRYSASFRLLDFDFHSGDYARALDQIEAECRRVDAEIILPSDDVSTRLLIALRDRLPLPTSALPPLAGFDALNNKWNFARLALANGVRVPNTALFKSTAEIKAAVDEGRLSLPLTMKPVNLSGTAGVRHLHTPSDVMTLGTIDYQPILVQSFVRGREINVNVLCRNGEIVAHVVQHRGARSFAFLENDDLLANAARAVRAANFHGPANFDTIVSDADGLGYLLECNPRFFYSIYLSAVLGLNFVDGAMRLDREPGLSLPARTDGTIRLNRELFLSPLKPWRISHDEWRLLGYHAADPVPMLCDRFNLLLGGQVAVPREVMADYGSNQDHKPVAAE